MKTGTAPSTGARRPLGPIRRSAARLWRRRWQVVGGAGVIWLVLFLFHITKPLPEGTSFLGPLRGASEIEFLHDLSYRVDGQPSVEQEIFDRVLGMIDAAEEFVVIDMFLFDGEHGGEREYRALSSELADRLLARKAANPALRTIFITDEINNFYGAYTGAEIRRLQLGGVQVVTTRLSRLRDSNAAYSAGWRMLGSWLGTGGPGWLPHPLSSTGQKVTARSYFKLLNFKANHRKLIVTERECLVSSANPHDASSFHSNIAFVGSGPICGDILEAERAVARFSGAAMEDWPTYLGGVSEGRRTPEPASVPEGSGDPGHTLQGEAGTVSGTVQLVTEGKILEALLADLGAAQAGDRIDLAMFYLSERRVLRELLDADARGASIRLVLDPNKDAFGREKGGIPNRQVAKELIDKSAGRISVRWYDTHGEQFHTKLVLVGRSDSVTILGGSANLTRRNIGDFNLEADLRFVVPVDAPLAAATTEYFDRIFQNRGGAFTVPFEAYQDDSWIKTVRYRLEEATGFCSY